MKKKMETDTVEKRTIEVIQEVLRIPLERLQSQCRFREDLGADSLDLISLMMAFEEEFKRPISEEDAAKLLTVSDAVQYITTTATLENNG
jgi:acyl carrier protein